MDSPSDSYRLVSAADCRFMAFESVNEATRLWIKGREFSVARLLGDAYKVRLSEEKSDGVLTYSVMFSPKQIGTTAAH